MEISKDALMRVIKATRLTLQLAEDIQRLMMQNGSVSVADEIAGELADALFEISGEQLLKEQDFGINSTTMQLIKSSMPDETIAELFEVRSRVFDRIHQMQEEEQKQPKPNTIEKPDFMNLYRQFGGYSTPEGEWK